VNFSAENSINLFHFNPRRNASQIVTNTTNGVSMVCERVVCVCVLCVVCVCVVCVCVCVRVRVLTTYHTEHQQWMDEINIPLPHKMMERPIITYYFVWTPTHIDVYYDESLLIHFKRRFSPNIPKTAKYVWGDCLIKVYQYTRTGVLYECYMSVSLLYSCVLVYA
jgi:hypothetical protein